MLSGFLIIAIIALLGVLTHRRSSLEERVMKNVPLTEWLTVLFIPVGLYIGWVFIVRNILSRPLISIFPLDDLDILAATVLFMVYGMVGNAIHFTAKILWRYLKEDKDDMAYRINEMFHGKLSHYLTFLSGAFIIFTLPILEINHPLTISLPTTQIRLIALVGFIFGMSAIKAVLFTNEWFGGYNKTLFAVIVSLLGLLIFLRAIYNLNFHYYPVYLFIHAAGISIVGAFVVREILIYSPLGRKKSMRFLSKILSAGA